MSDVPAYRAIIIGIKRTQYLYGNIMRCVALSLMISLYFSHPSNAWGVINVPCPVVEKYDFKRAKNAKEIRESILQHSPTGSRASCWRKGYDEDDIKTEIIFQNEPLDIYSQRVMSYHYTSGFFNPKEYRIEILLRVKSFQDEFGNKILQMVNEIEDVRVHEITETEKKEYSANIANVSVFDFSTYKNEADAQEAFRKLYPTGSPAHLAHYTLLKSGYFPGYSIENRITNQQDKVDIIFYIFKRDPLGWNQIQVQVFRKVENNNITNIIEKVNVYRSYQGL